jgi:hypothetical protein
VTAALQKAVDAVTTLGIAALGVVVAAAAAIAGVTLIVDRPADVVDFADGHTVLVAVGGAIALAAAALVGGVTALLRRT